MIYIGVLILYLGLLVFIGVITQKRIKTHEGFALGGREVGPWVTAFSFVAAYFSSVVIVGGGGFGYKFGMSTIWIGTANVLLGCALAWIVLAKRIREHTQKLNAISVPDLFAKHYKDEFVRKFSAWVIVIFMLVYNISILKGTGNMFQVLMNLDYKVGVLLSAIVMIFYVALGGYLAVVWTGFLQAWVMIFGLLLLLSVVLHKGGGFALSHIKLQALNPGFVSTPGVWNLGELISFALVVSFGVWGMPQLVVRFYSIKSTKVIKIATVLATIGGSLAIIPYFTGALGRIFYPNLLDADLIIPTLVKNLLSTWGGAVFLACVIAAGMSTFSSVLIIISTSIVHDILKLKGEEALKFNKVFTIIAGLISLGLALKPPALILVICAFAWGAISSTCLWPILFTVYGKVNPKSIRWSMIFGLATALIWQILKPVKLHGFIPGIVVALLVIGLFPRQGDF